MRVRLCWLVALLAALGLIAVPTGAQSGGSVVLFSPQTDTFPRIQVYLDVHNAQGEFVHGLRADDVQVLENGRPLPLAEFSVIRPGVQLVVVINPGASFAIRNSQGVSRYDLLRASLSAWLERRGGSTIDDLSLLLSGGGELTHVADPALLKKELEAYRPDPRSLNPGLEILSRAIDLAVDPSPRGGMERAVLFITSPLPADRLAGLETLMTRASQQRVRVLIWMVASPEAGASQAALQFQRLAEQTSGGFLTFTAQEALPDPETFLNQLRDVCSLSYDSQATQGGIQRLVVEIRREGEVLQSPALEFNLDLRPPEPVFISPPVQIIRQPSSASGQGLLNALQGMDDLHPTHQDLSVLIDFPDGHPRPLRRTALFVDGKLYQERNAPPFDQFTWDLNPYTSSGRHVLQLEAVDSLGLSGKSMVTLVEVVVRLPKISPWLALLPHWPLLGGLTLLLGGSLTVLILILSGRLHPHPFPRFARRRPAPPTTAQSVTSTPARGTGRDLSAWVNRLHWPQRRIVSRPWATLIPLSESPELPQRLPLPLSFPEITLGRDPTRATLLLDDPSVDALHARLLLTPEGTCRLLDEGSVAGTWVNYMPVPPEGQVVEHGDVVHFGRLGFRFTLREARQKPSPQVTLMEKEP